MANNAERPKREQEIIASQEAVSREAWRKEQVHREIGARLEKYDELAGQVVIAERRLNLARKKHENLKAVAESSGHMDSFRQEIEVAGRTLREIQAQIDEIYVRLRPVEAQLLAFASEYVAIEGNKEESLQILQEATEHFELVIATVTQENAHELEGAQNAFDEERKKFEHAITEFSREYKAVTGWDTHLRVNSADNEFDEKERSLRREAEATEDMRRSKVEERDNITKKNNSFYLASDGNWVTRNFKDRIVNEETRERRSFTGAEIVEGKWTQILSQRFEEAKTKLEAHKQKKPGFFGIFGETKKWQEEMRLLEQDVSRVEVDVAEAREEQESVQRDLDVYQEKIDVIKAKADRIKALKEQLETLRQTKHSYQNANQRLDNVTRRIRSHAHAAREGLQAIEVATRHLNLNIDHPIMDKVRSIQRTQEQAEEVA